MYDMDDAGVGVDNVSWRGTLVLQRIREAADGKYDGKICDEKCDSRFRS